MISDRWTNQTFDLDQWSESGLNDLFTNVTESTKHPNTSVSENLYFNLLYQKQKIVVISDSWTNCTWFGSSQWFRTEWIIQELDWIIQIVLNQQLTNSTYPESEQIIRSDSLKKIASKELLVHESWILLVFTNTKHNHNEKIKTMWQTAKSSY